MRSLFARSPILAARYEGLAVAATRIRRKIIVNYRMTPPTGRWGTGEKPAARLPICEVGLCLGVTANGAPVVAIKEHTIPPEYSQPVNVGLHGRPVGVRAIGGLATILALESPAGPARQLLV